MLFLLLSLVGAPVAAASQPRHVVVLDVAAAGVVDGLDRAAFAAVSDRVAAAVARDADVVVSTVDAACADDACAAAHGDDVFWGTLSHDGPLFLLDLHVHEARRGGSIVRARLEAPDLETLGQQIDDAAPRMLGKEPARTLSPVVVGGAVAASVGAVAAVVGAAGVAWAFATDDAVADDLFVPSIVVGAAGVVLAVVGVSVVGAAVDE